MPLSATQLAYELLVNAIEHDLMGDYDDDLFDALYDEDYDELKTIELAMSELFTSQPRETAVALRLLEAGAFIELHVYLTPLIDVILDRQSVRYYQGSRRTAILCPAA